jgi:hypothetical protein
MRLQKAISHRWDSKRETSFAGSEVLTVSWESILVLSVREVSEEEIA